MHFSLIFRQVIQLFIISSVFGQQLRWNETTVQILPDVFQFCHVLFRDGVHYIYANWQPPLLDRFIIKILCFSNVILSSFFFQSQTATMYKNDTPEYKQILKVPFMVGYMFQSVSQSVSQCVCLSVYLSVIQSASLSFCLATFSPDTAAISGSSLQPPKEIFLGNRSEFLIESAQQRRRVEGAQASMMDARTGS